MTRVFTDVEKRYMRDDGCPFCKSKLESDDLEFIDGEVLRAVYCTNRECSAEFQETWVLKGAVVVCPPYQR